MISLRVVLHLTENFLQISLTNSSPILNDYVLVDDDASYDFPVAIKFLDMIL